jgi:hypothetical protein
MGGGFGGPAPGISTSEADIPVRKEALAPVCSPRQVWTCLRESRSPVTPRRGNGTSGCSVHHRRSCRTTLRQYGSSQSIGTSTSWKSRNMRVTRASCFSSNVSIDLSHRSENGGSCRRRRNPTPTAFGRFPTAILTETRSVSEELRSDGPTNVLNPGVMPTRLLEHYGCAGPNLTAGQMCSEKRLPALRSDLITKTCRLATQS